MKLALIAAAALMLQACAPTAPGYEPEFALSAPAPQAHVCPDPGGLPLDLGAGLLGRVVRAKTSELSEGLTLFVQEPGTCFREVFTSAYAVNVEPNGQDLIATYGILTEAGRGKARVTLRYSAGRYRTAQVLGCQPDFSEPLPMAECEELMRHYATP